MSGLAGAGGTIARCARLGARLLRLAGMLVCSLALASLHAVPALGAPDQSVPDPRPTRPEARRDRTVDDLSVVKLRSKAVTGARSSRVLGAEREGTGVVIDAKGLVLTIGYLILEAETVELSTADGTVFPATVIAYDSVTGFGLLRSLRPLPIAPVQIGQSSTLGTRARVLIVGFDGVAPAIVVSRRPFVGYWEYLLEDAIYTAPATVNWSGAALLDHEGKLLGIGSLSVNDAVGPDSHVAGNMFVPIDLLKPLLGDLVAHGKSSAPARPWIGVQTREVQGNVIVTRVSPEGPADAAGMQPGDVIVSLGGQLLKGQADFYTRLWARGRAGVEVSLAVLRAGRIQGVTITSTDRDTYYRVKPTF